MKSTLKLKFTGIIPARFASSRFPGKPLAMIGGKSMIQRVYEQASKALEEVWVATDNDSIREAVLSFGGKVVMTSSSHRSGTDRCAEAARLIFSENPADENVIINIQGDEPFIKPQQIVMLSRCFDQPEVQIATLIRKVSEGEDLSNVNHPKVVVSKEMDALFFSRSVIPFLRDSKPEEWASKHDFYKHLGLYGYRLGALLKITALPQSSLEKAESLEQLRWIENGYKIRCAVTPWESIGIDTPEDLARAEALLLSDKSI